MQSLRASEFRPLLDEAPPFFTDRVNNPWEDRPDVEGYNGKAFQAIRRKIKRLDRALRQGERPPTEGLVLVGQAGMGKTHLLMRAARELSGENHIMFIRKPNNQEAVAQHLWSNMISSLVKPIPGGNSEQTQLHAFLAHIFVEILTPELEEDVREGKDADLKERWLERWRESPSNFFEMFSEAETNRKYEQILRNKILNYLQEKEPEVDRRVVRALVNYCFYRDSNRRRTVLTWLQGQQIEEGAARLVGTETWWVQVEDHDSAVTIRQAKEEQALRAIQTLGLLSTYYHPLILAFDQLEGLSKEPDVLTYRFGDVLREIFTMTPNLLVIACVFPDTWDEWFSEKLDDSTLERLGQKICHLEEFDVKYGRDFIAAQMALAHSEFDLPDEIYPFTDWDIEILCEKSKKPRTFIREARERFYDWLDEDENVFPDEPVEEEVVEDEPEPVSESEEEVRDRFDGPAWEKAFDEGEGPGPDEVERSPVGEVLWRDEEEPVSSSDRSVVVATPPVARAEEVRRIVLQAVAAYREQEEEEYDLGTPNDTDLEGRLKTLVRFLCEQAGEEVEFTEISYELVNNLQGYKKVMPNNFAVRRWAEEKAVAVAVCNENTRKLTPRVQNLDEFLKVANGKIRAIAIRDSRCDTPGEKGHKVLKQIGRKYGKKVSLGRAEFGRVNSFYEVLTAVEQRDLEVDDEEVTLAELYQVMIGSGLLNQSTIFKGLMKELQGLDIILEIGDEGGGDGPAVTTSSREERGFPTLGLAPGPPDYLKAAAQAVDEEHSQYRYVRRLQAKKIERVAEEGIYIIHLAGAQLMDWTWEGSLAFDHKKNIYHRMFPEQIRTDSIWWGDVISVDEEEEKIYIYCQDPDRVPRKGGFYIQLFDFLAGLHELYWGKETSSLRAHLPARLAMAKGDSDPPLVSGNSEVARDALEDLWNYSWPILWGPPGTGKTTAIGRQVARAMEDDGERILVVSSTNQATDEVALSIGWALKGTKWEHQLGGTVVRLGRGSDYRRYDRVGMADILAGSETDLRRKLSDLRHQLAGAKGEEKAELQLRIKILQKMIQEQGEKVFLEGDQRVVITTAFQGLHLLLRKNVREELEEGNMPFTSVIVDEGGIMSRAAAAGLSLLAKRRFMLVGDPRQLSPINQMSRVLPTHQATWLGDSGLGHLQDASDSHTGVLLLKNQHRMHPEIRRAVSHYQYQGTLKDSPEIEGRRWMVDKKLEGQPRAIWYVLDEDAPDLPLVRAERGENNRSWQRLYTLYVLKKILMDHPHLAEGQGLFLSPFSAQVWKAKEFFKREGFGSWQGATIHSQQGAEADVVIFDTVNAGSFGWAHDEWKRMINVAMSRARHQLILVASRGEMAEPFLASIVDGGTLAPKIYHRRAWRDVEAEITFDIPDEIAEDPNKLGHQLEKRKILRPILSADQERLCHLSMDGKPRLVRGVAGSGKTLVMARWLAKTVHREKSISGQIWVVYANRSLEGHIKDNVIEAWNSLDEDREFPWNRVSFFHIQHILERRLGQKVESFDYNKAALQHLLKTEGKKSSYSCQALFIDEAQDFGHHCLQLLINMVQPSVEGDDKAKPVMIFYDNAQNLYQTKTPKWADFGLDMRGRSTVMKESFRSTQPLCEYAVNVLYQLEPPEDDGGHDELVERGLLVKEKRDGRTWWKVNYNHVQGPLPLVDFEGAGKRDEMRRMVRQISQWISEEGVKPGDITILTMGKMKNFLERELAGELEPVGAKVAFESRKAFTKREDTIVVTTPHSFKGYDSEIVVIPGADRFLAREAKILAKVLYVAMTRARSVLALYGQSKKNETNAPLVEAMEECYEILKKEERKGSVEE